MPKVGKTVEEADVATMEAPPDSEWMDGDAFAYIRHDDVCMCATGIHDTAVRYFLAQFFMKANFRHDADKFDLIKAADISKVKLLQSEGVDEIELRGILYKAGLHYQQRKNQPQGLLGGFAKQLKALLGAPHDVNEDALKVLLTLKTDKRLKGMALGDKRMRTLAADIVKNQADGDDYVIITKKGRRITQKEIFIRTTVEMDGHGKSVQRDKAWKELTTFYKSLYDSGALVE